MSFAALVFLLALPASAQTTPGLVAAYGFNEGTGSAVADASGNNNNGTLSSGVSWSSPGKFGNALRFNGTNGLVTIPDSASLRLTTAMTLEAWVMPTAVTGIWRDIVYKGKDNYYLMGDSTNAARPATGGIFGAATAQSLGTKLTLNTWTHLAGTYDGATLILFVNGVQASSVARTGSLVTSSNPLQIGGDSLFGQYFQGVIDEVRVYNRALTPTEIQTDMNTAVGGTLPPTDTLAPSVAITAPTSGTTFTTNSSPMTLGGTAVDNVGVTQVSWTNNRGGSGTATITATTWTASGIALLSGTNTLTVTARDAANNTGTATVTVTYDATAPTVSLAAPAAGATVSGTTTVTANAADNIGVVGVLFLLDGVALGAEQPGPSFSVPWTTSSVTNGVHTLSARARDAAGNTALATVSVTVANIQSSGLVAAYGFSEGTGGSIADASGNNNNGTLSSGVTWSAQGRFGNALVFNGTSGVVTIPDSATLRLTTAMTLEAWIKPSTTLAGWRDVVYKGNDNYFLEASSSRNGVPVGGGTFGEANGTAALQVNTWTHMAVTYDKATLRLYVNGVQVSSAAFTGSIATSTNPLQLGGDNIYGQYFQGLIDEVRVYNRALALAEIQADMNTAVGGTAPPTDTTAPTPPSGLGASALSSGQIALTWTASTDNVGVTAYLIERCQGAGCTTFAQVATSTGASYTDAGLLASATYGYRVRATDAASNLSSYSSTASATTQASGTGAQPVFLAEAHSATDGAGADFNRASITLNVSGTNPVLFAAWHSEYDGGNPDSWSVTCNGVAGTPIVDTDGYTGGAGNRRFRIYYWQNPTPGLNTIVVSNPYNGPNELAVSAILLGSVMPTNPLGAVALDVSTLARTGESETVATTTNDLVVHVIADALLTRGNLGSGETSRSVANDGVHPVDGDASLWISTKPGDASTTTVSSSGWAARVINGAAIVVHGAASAAASLAVVPDMTLTKAHTGAFTRGQIGATYTLSATNIGTASTTGAVTVTDTLPSGLTATGMAGTGWTCTLGTLTCTRNDALAAGASYPSITLTVNVGTATASSVTNTASVSGGGDTNTVNNAASDVTSVNALDSVAPSAPGTLTAAAVSGTQVNLGWGASQDNIAVTKYIVYRCQGAACGDFVNILVTPSTPTTISDTGLTPNTSYTYVLRASDAAGNLSPASNTATVTTLTTVPELVAAYSFEEGAGSTVTDASGHGNTGTIQNATWTAAGRYGKALVFNGSNALVTIPDSPSVRLTTAMTLEAWVNPSTVSSAWRDVIYKGIDNYYLEATSSNSGRPAARAGVDKVYGTGSLPVNTWSHLAATYDGATLRLYVNGVQISSLPTSGGITTSTNPLQIGGDSIFGQYFQGIIDEVRVYNVARTLTQIQADANAPIGSVGLPVVSLSSSSLNLGTQTTNTTSNAQIVTVTNSGSANLAISGIAILGAHSADFSQGNSCGSTLAPSASCLISVTFTPQAAGARVATLTISDNAPGSPHAIALAGIGSAGLSISPSVAVLTPSQTQQFTASASGVVWSVDGVVGGTGVSGTITTGGLFTPPNGIGTHTVTATTADKLQSGSATVNVTAYPGTFTHHNDNARTGRNLNETVLTPANVNLEKFGKLFSYQLDGVAHASPLYVAGVSVPGLGLRNVVYVSTEHNSVYAFDADGRSNTPLWRMSFINPAAGITTVPPGDTEECCDISPEIGITGTPVIDAASGTLYVVAKTKEVSGSVTNYVQRLHALDIATGAEKFGGPMQIQATVPGTGSGSVSGQLAFEPLRQNQRPALLLSNGAVYVAFGGHGDHQPYHGWVLGYNAATLQQVMALCLTPNGEGAGVWMSNGGVAADSAGNLYFSTGDGTFDPSTRSYGDSLVKINPVGTVLDYFTPSNQAALNASDIDFGASGVLLLPDQSGTHPHLVISAGKNATIHLIDRDNMGRFNAAGDTLAVQSLQNIFPFGTPEPGNYSSPVYFNGTVYFSPVADAIKAFPLNNGLLSTFPASQSSAIFAYRGGALAISANGSANGILWAVERTSGTTPGVLRAYDPSDLGVQLYNSSQAGTRDTLDVAGTFSVPLVANGKVFVGTVSQLIVYGLLP